MTLPPSVVALQFTKVEAETEITPLGLNIAPAIRNDTEHIHTTQYTHTHAYTHTHPLLTHCSLTPSPNTPHSLTRREHSCARCRLSQ